jgi:pimeloyl-ACP methyl ester carboxylesterase
VSPAVDVSCEAGRHRQTAIAGGVTHWWDYGVHDAEATFLLVHGFRGDHHGLEPLAKALLAALPIPARVVIPDLPGFGRSSTGQDFANLALFTAWLHAFTAAISPLGPPILIGHSFGSVIAAAASAGPLKESAIRRLVLINPIGAPALAGPRRLATAATIGYYRLAGLLPERPGLALLCNPAIVRVMSMAMAKTRDRRLRRWIHDQHRRYFSVFQDRGTVLDAFRTSVENDVSMFAAHVTTPTLLIASDKDDITTIPAQRRLQALFPEARLSVIHGAGHLVHYEAPAIAAREIARFMAGDSGFTDHEGMAR